MNRDNYHKLKDILSECYSDCRKIEEEVGVDFEANYLEIPLHRAVDEIDNLINTRELQTVIEVLMDLLLKMNKSERANENI